MQYSKQVNYVSHNFNVAAHCLINDALFRSAKHVFIEDVFTCIFDIIYVVYLTSLMHEIRSSHFQKKKKKDFKDFIKQIITFMHFFFKPIQEKEEGYKLEFRTEN